MDALPPGERTPRGRPHQARDAHEAPGRARHPACRGAGDKRRPGRHRDRLPALWRPGCTCGADDHGCRGADDPLARRAVPRSTPSGSTARTSSGLDGGCDRADPGHRAPGARPLAHVDHVHDRQSRGGPARSRSAAGGLRHGTSSTTRRTSVWRPGGSLTTYRSSSPHPHRPARLLTADAGRLCDGVPRWMEFLLGAAPPISS